MKLIEYSSNNSGGDWWLKDEDWKNLEKAGWKIVYAGQDFVWNKRGGYTMLKNGFPKLTPRNKRKERYLGAIATTAFRIAKSEEDAIREWEEITGQWASEEGCHCCGRPHNFDTI